MTALLYGVVPSPIELQIAGVAGMPVLSHARDKCTVLYSVLPDSHALNSEDVIAFHELLKAVLERTDVVSFRFPTAIPMQEIEERLERHTSRFCGALDAISGRVQMDLEWPLDEAALGISSGTSYLRSKAAATRRQRDTVEDVQIALRSYVNSVISTTKRRRIVIQTLISRDAIRDFVADARRIFPQVRITGPWPPSAFIEAVLHD